MGRRYLGPAPTLPEHLSRMDDQPDFGAAVAAANSYTDTRLLSGDFTNIVLNTGYASVSGYLAPALRRNFDGSWSFRGRVRRTAGNLVANTAYAFGTLPNGEAPARQIIIGGAGTAGGTFSARVWIEASGIISMSASGAATDIDLSGLRVEDPYS